MVMPLESTLLIPFSLLEKRPTGDVLENRMPANLLPPFLRQQLTQPSGTPTEEYSPIGYGSNPGLHPNRFRLKTRKKGFIPVRNWREQAGAEGSGSQPFLAPKPEKISALVTIDIDLVIHLKNLCRQGDISIIVMCGLDRLERVSEALSQQTDILSSMLQFYAPAQFESFLKGIISRKSPKGFTWVSDRWYHIQMASRLGITPVGLLEGASQPSAIHRQKPSLTIRSLRDLSPARIRALAPRGTANTPSSHALRP